MAEFDSLSFALLIPFAICFVLVFIVCCFADEIKDICRMPSPLPSSYLAADHSRSNRRRSRRHSRQGRPQNEEVRNLILSEEGRSRNVSESSTDLNPASNVLVHSNSNLAGQHGASLQQHVMMLPQTTISTGGQMLAVPVIRSSASQSTINSVGAQHGAHSIIIQPLGHFAAQNASRNGCRNYSRNLAIHASSSSKDIGACLKQNQKSHVCESGDNNSQKADINKNKSAPDMLNDYLSSDSSNRTDALNTTKQESNKSDQL